jgi:arsenate reductase-like glutaredoxin family protein
LKELINTKSQSFKKLKPDLNAMNEEDIIALINNDPRIMRRPLLTRGKRLLFGFDSEAYRQFLS